MISARTGSIIASFAFVYSGLYYNWAYRKLKRCVDRERFAKLEEGEDDWNEIWPTRKVLKQEGMVAYHVRNVSAAIMAGSLTALLVIQFSD